MSSLTVKTRLVPLSSACRKAKKAASAVAEQGGAHIGDVVTVRLRSDNEAISLGLTCDEPLQFELGSEGFLGNELYQVLQRGSQK